MKLLFSTLITIFILLPIKNTFADIAVIVGSKSPITSATQSEIKKVFLGKSTTIGGQKVTPAFQKDNSPSNSIFSDLVLGKSTSDVWSIWVKLVFSGKIQAFKVVNDATEAKAFVNNNTGGISYIDASAVDATVKKIFTAK